MSNWWDVLDENDFDPVRDMAVFHWPARAYAVSKWKPRGLLGFEDYASLALLALVELAHSNFVPESSAGFWVTLKRKIDWTIQEQVQKKWDNDPSAVGSYDGDWDPAEVFTQLRTTRKVGDGLLHHTITDRIATLPRYLKVALGLRFFEGMTQDKIGGMIDATKKVPGNWVRGTCAHLLDQALRQVLDTPPEEPVDLPTSGKDYVVALEVAAEAFVFERYGTDVSGWLGWLQIAYQEDVTYVLDMIDTAHGHTVRAGTSVRLSPTAADVAHLNTWERPPISIADVRARTDWGVPRCSKALAEWRLAHGIETPRTGGDTLAERRRRGQAA